MRARRACSSVEGREGRSRVSDGSGGEMVVGRSRTEQSLGKDLVVFCGLKLGEHLVLLNQITLLLRLLSVGSNDLSGKQEEGRGTVSGSDRSERCLCPPVH